MKNNRRKTLSRLLLPLAAIVIISALVVTMTLALFVDTSDKATNSITLGQIGVNCSLVIDNATAVSDVTVDAEAKVTNSSELPTFIRARVIHRSDVEVIKSNIDNSDNASGETWKSVDDADGYKWYYYNQILQPGTTTSSIIATVTYSDTLTQAQIDAVQSDPDLIIVYAEAVQAWVGAPGSYAQTAEQAFAALG
ncbi:MAG: hypothetical protein LBN30_02595 [Oscillospiraceae bacterium]|jgi:hypothetical protein|nr:hypothetical protein [Oscillospiraceae bacterium]